MTTKSKAMSEDPVVPDRCPLCGATVPEGQTKCLFCGTLFEVPRPSEPSEPVTSANERLMSWALVFLGVATLALWLGVARASVLAGRGWFLLSVVGLTHLVVAWLVGLDAKRLDVARRGFATPRRWFVATLVVMPLAIIVYGAVRPRCEAGDVTRPALVLALLWVGSLTWVGLATGRAPALPPELQKQWQQQLERTLEVAPPASFDPNATVSPPSAP